MNCDIVDKIYLSLTYYLYKWDKKIEKLIINENEAYIMISTDNELCCIKINDFRISVRISSSLLNQKRQDIIKFMTLILKSAPFCIYHLAINNNYDNEDYFVIEWYNPLYKEKYASSFLNLAYDELQKEAYGDDYEYGHINNIRYYSDNDFDLEDELINNENKVLFKKIND